MLEQEKTVYRPVSKFQPARRDLAFVVPESVTYARLEAALDSVNDSLIRAVALFDVYRGAGLPENMRSMAVKVVLQDSESTMTDDAVEAVIGKLVIAARSVGAELR